MRLFCDQCGTEFGTATLRPDSKFCSLCGKTLSEYVKQQRNALFVKSPKHSQSGKSAGVAISGKRRKIPDEEEEDSMSEEQKRKRGRPRRPNVNGTAPDNGDSNDETSTEENHESEETEGVFYHCVP